MEGFSVDVLEVPPYTPFTAFSCMAANVFPQMLGNPCIDAELNLNILSSFQLTTLATSAHGPNRARIPYPSHGIL